MKVRSKYLRVRGDQLTRLCTAAKAFHDAQQCVDDALTALSGLTAPVSDLDKLIKLKRELSIWAVRIENPLYQAADALYGARAQHRFPILAHPDQTAAALATAKEMEAGNAPTEMIGR